jgi:methylamine--corrinoid protein Co-methyltransferase
MKIDFGAMNKIAYLLNWGANIGAETSPILGGYCGGPEGTTVVSTAYILMGLLVHQETYQLTFPVHFRYGCSTTRNGCGWWHPVVRQPAVISPCQ